MQAALDLVPAYRRFFFGALSVLLAVWAQWALFSHKLILDGLALFALSAILFVLVVLPGQRLVETRAAPVDASGGTQPIRWARVERPLAAVLVCAALAWLFSDGNRFRPETLLFWFLACVIYLWAFWDRSGSSPGLGHRLRSLARRDVTLPWTAVGLGLVILMGAFLRFHQIASVPAEMVSDHAEKLLDVRDVLEGQHRIFFPRNTGREPLVFYTALPFVAVAGLSHLALKLLTATVSLLTVPVVYFLGREIGGARFGLLAAFFLAVLRWDFSMGRLALRVPFLPLFTALSFLFLLRAVRHGRRNDYLLCGVFTGVGLYGYSPFRAMGLLILALVLVKMASEARRGWAAVGSVVQNAALCLGAILLVLVPLARYMMDNPQMFWLRALTRVSGLERPLPANPLQVLRENLANGLLMFNWRGDTVWVNTIPMDPVLEYVTGGLFVLGVVWCLYEMIRHREPVGGYLLVALLVMLLPSVLSLSFPQENPSVIRAGGATPFVALLVAAPVYLATRRLSELWPTDLGRALVVGMLAILLTLAVRVEHDRYFVDFATQYRNSARNATEIAAVMGNFARSVGTLQNAYIKAWPHWVDTRNVAFSLGAPDWNNVLNTPADVAGHIPQPGNRLYVLNRDDRESVRMLQQRFPEAQLWERPSASPGKQFLVLFVPEKP